MWMCCVNGYFVWAALKCGPHTICAYVCCTQCMSISGNSIGFISMCFAQRYIFYCCCCCFIALVSGVEVILHYNQWPPEKNSELMEFPFPHFFLKVTLFNGINCCIDFLLDLRYAWFWVSGHSIVCNIICESNPTVKSVHRLWIAFHLPFKSHIRRSMSIFPIMKRLAILVQLCSSKRS